MRTSRVAAIAGKRYKAMEGRENMRVIQTNTEEYAIGGGGGGAPLIEPDRSIIVVWDTAVREAPELDGGG